MRQTPAEMDLEEIEAEIEHLESYMDECVRIEQGISSKDGSRLRQLKAEIDARSRKRAA